MSDGFGRYDVYATAGSLYCYAETDILRNRLGIRDRETLRKFESGFSSSFSNSS